MLKSSFHLISDTDNVIPSLFILASQISILVTASRGTNHSESVESDKTWRRLTLFHEVG